MTMFRPLAALLVMLSLWSHDAPAGARPVAVRDDIVLPGDADQRALLLRVSFPPRAGRRPVVILSHGNRLSRQDYDPLVRHWAAAGFIVIQADHVDSAGLGAPPTPTPPTAWRSRVDDLHRILDRLDAVGRALAASGTRTDRRRIAIAGHSFGGQSAALLVGERVRDPKTGVAEDLFDPRIRAALLLAPPGGADGLRPDWRVRAPYLDADFSGLRGPLLIVTGSEDDSPMAATGPIWHQDVFLRSAASGICLLTIAGADHYLGGISRSLGPGRAADPAMLARVRAVTTRYLKAALARRPWRGALQDHGARCR